MKKYIQTLTIGTLALLLVASPLAGFAKEKENKKNGNGNEAKKEQVVNKNDDRNENDNKRNDDNDKKKNGSDSKNDDNKNKSVGQNSCVKAFGHLIAPGWLKKNGDTIDRDYIAQNCWLPFGIAKKFRGNNASTTPDVTAPVISNIRSNPAKKQAEVKWATNEFANSTVYWNTSSSVDTSDTAAQKVVNNRFVKNHQVILRNLTPNTTYYFVVRSRDGAGNSAVSGVNSFTTKPASSTDSQLPVISNVVTVVGTTTIQVGWKTNENTTDRVYYSTILPVTLNASTTLYVSNASTTKTHLVTLPDLTSNTTYYLVIESTDGAGNSATFGAHTNSVPAVPVIPDITAPVISSVILAIPGSSTTTLTWKTDELSTSKVFYSTVNPLDVNASTTLSILNSGLVYLHTVQVSGLATSTTYYFKVQSVDASGNTATSGQVTATTTSGM